MSKCIEISNAVYRRHERGRGYRRISATIAELLESGGSLQDVSGHGIFAPDSYEVVNDEIR